MKQKILLGFAVFSMGFLFGYGLVIWFANPNLENELWLPLKECSIFEISSDLISQNSKTSPLGNLRLIKKDVDHFDLTFNPFVSDTYSFTLKNIKILPLSNSISKTHIEKANIEVDSPSQWKTEPSLVAELSSGKLWKIALFAEENGEKALLYQGQFQFPWRLRAKSFCQRLFTVLFAQKERLSSEK